MKPKFCSKHVSSFDKKVKKTRAKIKALNVERLTVIRSNKNISAQVFTADGSKVLVAASSLEGEIKSNKPKDGGKTAVARLVGQLLGRRAKEQGIEKMAFDRSGFKYHGRIKALAEGVREEGVNC